MKRLAILMAIVAGLVVTNACMAGSSNRPADFNLSLYWDTGALPPAYHYSYTLKIDQNGMATFTYQPGYEEDKTYSWGTQFNLTEGQMDDLYQYVQGQDVLRSDWAKGQLVMGGYGTEIKITQSGHDYRIPSLSELNKTDRQVVNDLIDKIKSVVPQSVWDEMDQRQSKYEKEMEQIKP